MTLREQLQDALGSAYTIQRELGGGGMSRVFVARDETLGRDVVVKVLPPDLLAGVSAERFDREIRLAAGLQHAHIVPVLHAGQTDGVPYYTMPFVEGASLRDRLTREGRLPIPEVVSILRDVARALAYAHERGIVHRDIKPDNVLLSGGAAVVTDFGIAKAISAARSGASGDTLTQMGVSIGTPAYMAPEQAAADPATDHRADIYSFGCLAYEMLTGRPPFTARSPQRLLAAHMSEAPEPVGAIRPDVPGPLAELVAGCLAKEPNERPQRASEILQRLDAATSGDTDSMPMLIARGRGILVRALVLYAVAFAVVAMLARLAISAIGLPDWVFPGALIVMALGLPVVLFTAYMHRVARTLGASAASTPAALRRRSSGTMATMAVRARPHWSWRRAAIGGAIALGGFIALVAGYMTLRAMGIGPAGSLLAAGTIGEHDQLLVTDLQSPASDSTLGPVVTDALRTALAQSNSVTVLQPNAIQEVLRRMERSPGTRVDFALAKEIAEREGISVILDGRVIEVGGRYVFSLRLSSRSGQDLATFRQVADEQKDLLPAIDRAAREVRAKIGESLRSVQRTPPLEQVTTASLDALRKYVQGSETLTKTGDLARGTALLEEAIALDSSFAMAYRRLAIEYGNRRLRDRADVYYDKAFAHRARLSERERYLLLGSYYQNSRNQDDARARDAYERLLEIQPNDVIALNNLGILYMDAHQYAAADSLYARALRIESRPSLYVNRAIVQTALGRADLASATLDTLARVFPQNVRWAVFRFELLWTQGRYDSAAVVLGVLDTLARVTGDRGAARSYRSSLARLHGRLREARRLTYEAFEHYRAAGDLRAPLRAGLIDVADIAYLLGDSARATRSLDTLLRRHPTDSLHGFVSREYALLVAAHAMLGQHERARRLMEEWDVKRRAFRTSTDSMALLTMSGQVQLASGRHEEAARSLRQAGMRGCATCETPLEGRAWDLAGQPDSAIAALRRYAETKHLLRTEYDARFLPGVHKRLGELYEAKGRRDDALRHYRAFIELWKDADPELQPQVTDARQRVAALTRGSDVR